MRTLTLGKDPAIAAEHRAKFEANELVRAARLLNKPTLVSSVHRGNEIGVVLADRKEAWLAAHAKATRAPNGTGDLLTALYAASILEGQTLSYGLARAVGGVAAALPLGRTGKADRGALAALIADGQTVTDAEVRAPAVMDQPR